MSGESRHACEFKSAEACAYANGYESKRCICACHAPLPGPLAGSGEKAKRDGVDDVCQCGHRLIRHRAAVGDTRCFECACMDFVYDHTEQAYAPSLAVAPGESATGKDSLTVRGEEREKVLAHKLWEAAKLERMASTITGNAEDIGWAPLMEGAASALASARRQGRVEGLRTVLAELETAHTGRMFNEDDEAARGVAIALAIVHARLAETEKS